MSRRWSLRFFRRFLHGQARQLAWGIMPEETFETLRCICNARDGLLNAARDAHLATLRLPL
jgi:hypothetical protein